MKSQSAPLLPPATGADRGPPKLRSLRQRPLAKGANNLLKLKDGAPPARLLWPGMRAACGQLLSMLEPPPQDMLSEYSESTESTGTEGITAVLLREIKRERVLLLRCVQAFQQRQQESDLRPESATNEVTADHGLSTVREDESEDLAKSKVQGSPAYVTNTALAESQMQFWILLMSTEQVSVQDLVSDLPGRATQ
eukprot:g33586.t1